MGDLVIGARGAGEPEGSGGRTAQSTESAGPSEPTDGPGGAGGSADEGRQAHDGQGANGAPEVPEEAREKPSGERKQRSFWKELPILIGIALVLALVIKTFLSRRSPFPRSRCRTPSRSATGCWWTS